MYACMHVFKQLGLSAMEQVIACILLSLPLNAGLEVQPGRSVEKENAKAYRLKSKK